TPTFPNGSVSWHSNSSAGRARRTGEEPVKRWRQRGAPPSARLPGFVVARCLRPPAAFQNAAAGAIGLRRPRHVPAMRLLPGPRRVAFLRGWGVDHVVHPAVPFRRHLGGLGPVLVDDPAAWHPQRTDAAPLHEVAVAAVVAADERAAQGRIEAV